MLQSLDAASHRLEDGSYGLCLNCEEEISGKRLQAVPWTSFCLHCQEKVDQRQNRVLSKVSADYADYADSERMLRA
jgi:RNA polymerase-binding transcription factor DksA